jgi:hypothetical protein
MKSLCRAVDTQVQKNVMAFSSVPDPWHIGMDPDANPDPRIRTFDSRIRILLFPSVIKTPT